MGHRRGTCKPHLHRLPVNERVARERCTAVRVKGNVVINVQD